MSLLFSLNQIKEILTLEPCQKDEVLENVRVDSRLVGLGSLFFALQGERVDGHAFISEVVNKGASGAVVSEKYGESQHSPFLLPVENPLKALQLIAKKAIEKVNPRIVGITGSVGKTSSKEWVFDLLKDFHDTAASEGNQNSQIGLPITILNQLSDKKELLVLEMGLSKSGELSTLIEMAPPEIALITAVALVHAENFNTIEEIALAKAEIASHPKTKCAVFDKELLIYPAFKGLKKEKILFSVDDSKADYFIDRQKKILVSNLENRELSLATFPFEGRHHFNHLLSAVAIARYFGVSFSSIEERLNRLVLPAKRTQWIESKKGLFLNDSYNASEISVKAALEMLCTTKKRGKKVAVLGSMLELGKFSEECHRNVGLHALEKADLLYCLGEEMEPAVEVWKKAKRPVLWFKEMKPLVDELKKALSSEDVVLIKGSFSKRMWTILEEIEK